MLASMNMTLREQFDVLEYEGLWDEAIELAYENRDQTDAMCRCVFYGWYLYLESFCIEPAPSQEAIEKAQQNLRSVFPEAMKSEQPDVLMEIGYGMDIAFYLFPGDPNENNRRYTSILQRALELRPQDPICKRLYKGSIPGARDIDADMEFERWCALVANRYPGKGEYDKYFRSILTVETSQQSIKGIKGKLKLFYRALLKPLFSPRRE